MALVLPDTGEYEPQALIYHYILSSILSPATLDRASGTASHSQPRVRAVAINLGTSVARGNRKPSTLDITAITSGFTNKKRATSHHYVQVFFLFKRLNRVNVRHVPAVC